MLFKGTSVTVLAALLGLGIAQAQTLDRIGGPNEVPPSNYKDQTYIDSRGCVFLRVGYGGQINWVPRVTRDRKPMCGYAPTFAAKPADAPVQQAAAPVVLPPVPQPQLQPQAAGAPIDTVASLTTPPTLQDTTVNPVVVATEVAPEVEPSVAEEPKAMVAVQPVAKYSAPVVRKARPPAPGAEQVGCYTSVPVAQRLHTTDGGSVVICTKGNGTLEGARAPIYTHAGNGGAALIGAKGASGRFVTNQGGAAAQAPIALRALPAIPKGYKAAWSDDRLNPNRAVGTAAGQAQQDLVWTRQVPARLVSASRIRHQIVVSTKSAPDPIRQAAITPTKTRSVSAAGTAAAGNARHYVQIGTFGAPANAAAAKSRLRGAGFPVGTARVSKGGKTLQIVVAGPFPDPGKAKAALMAIRDIGFGDAFIR